MNSGKLTYRFQVCLLLAALCAGLMALPLSLSAQKTNPSLEIRSLDEEKLEEYRQNKEFQYGDQPGAPTQKSFQLPNFNFGSAAFWKTVLYTLLILIIVSLIAIILKFTLGKSSKHLPMDASPYLEDLDIRDVNLANLLQLSISERRYRDAVRLMYLQVLKSLSEKEWIDWKLYKTNYVYEQEMAGKALASEFSQLTMSFEYIWYGNYPVSQNLFSSLQHRFQTFHQKLSQQS